MPKQRSKLNQRKRDRGKRAIPEPPQDARPVGRPKLPLTQRTSFRNDEELARALLEEDYMPMYVQCVRHDPELYQVQLA
jgi:hypothetical protein